jgi:predicted DNA-binding transcriptional regulator AlpA
MIFDLPHFQAPMYMNGMTARRSDLRDLPSWPRGLSAEQAAAYVGVSVPTFLTEVKVGRWPAGQRRGARVVWDRRAIDLYFDRLSKFEDHEDLTEEAALARLQ